jgi:hypothetical protein
MTETEFSASHLFLLTPQGIAGTIYFVQFTVNAMLGLNNEVVFDAASPLIR